MSVVLRTVKAFPRGRTIEELHALLVTTFRHEERMALLGELEALAREGSIRRRHDGRWIPIGPPMTSQPGNPTTLTSSATSETSAIVAAPFLRTAMVSPPPIEERASGTHRNDPKALLRYWRSALRADPRGAITEAFDRHGTVWHLISGQGPLLPDEGQVVRLRIDLDALAPEFRAALVNPTCCGCQRLHRHAAAASIGHRKSAKSALLPSAARGECPVTRVCDHSSRCR
ncbi:hypothetical protein [Cereibacter johrii]|uniref:hypothetical protein n=1 Tax=Cereibacter johrii TaxID=445629 RepID=UPI0011BEA452|nr:hypothetical protein [Cereibacter johrii]